MLKAKMNVEIEAVRRPSAAQRVSPSSRLQAEAQNKVAAFAKTELQARAAHIGPIQTAFDAPPTHFIPNVHVVDIFTQASLTLFEAIPSKAPKVVIALLDGSAKAATMQALQAQAIEMQAKKRDVHFVVLHDAPAIEQVADRIALKKWFYPQQTLHHYHISGEDLTRLKTELAVTATPYHILCDVGHRVLAQGAAFSFDLLQPVVSLFSPRANSLLSPSSISQATPHSTLYVPHEACHGASFPDLAVVPLPAPNAQQGRPLFDLLVPTKYTVLDFWTTTCVKCPRAMEALVAHHAKNNVRLPLQYVLINTDDPIKAWDRVQANFKSTAVLNVYLPPSEKEALMQFLGMQQQSHALLLNPDRHIVANGMHFSWAVVDSTVAVVPPTPPSSPSASYPSHDGCVGKLIPNVPVQRLGTQQELLLHNILAPQTPVVFDFWSTTCVKCPEAIPTLLAHRDAHAGSSNVQYVLVSTDDPKKSWTLVQQRQWHKDSGVLHLNVGVQTKGVLQAFLGMKQLPHQVFLGPDHRVVTNGSNFSFAAVDAFLQAKPTAMPKTPLSPTAAHGRSHGKSFPRIAVTELRTRTATDFFARLATDRTCTVIVLWASNGPKCSVAVQALLAQAAASTHMTVQYVLVNTDDSAKDWTKILAKGWEGPPNVLHLHVAPPAREALERFLGLQTPHHVLLDAANVVVANGKFFTFTTVPTMAKQRLHGLPAVIASTHSLSLDEDF
ncbi:hypothetical protein ACHHYP_14098 [Achlya hypogyna]|uniref:Thioredoxin domain-containing protein n=1 Tax=Achlya hypogyna TaxID=1202772 RepID=A0A1V9YE00_ACHHY|nr:hypothetical protein ACHHYP_14098 [Achlya hypogyna]